MKTFHLTIAKIGENLFDGDAVSVTLPAVEGQLTVLAHHEPFVCELKAGTIRITTPDGEKQQVGVLARGVLEVSANQATVLL